MASLPFSIMIQWLLGSAPLHLKMRCHDSQGTMFLFEHHQYYAYLKHSLLLSHVLLSFSSQWQASQPLWNRCLLWLSVASILLAKTPKPTKG